MTKNRTTQEALTIARADHDSLAAELKRMSDSLLAREAQLTLSRRQGADAAKLHDLAGEVTTLRMLVDDQAGDVAEAAALVAELESAAEDEAILARIAEATVTYHEAEREHGDLLMTTEHAIAQAITRSDELKRAASAAKTAATDAAHQLAAKRSTSVDEALARAVNGSDVDPLPGKHAHLTAWPYGRRQIYKLLSQVQPQTKGVQVE